MKKLFVMGAYGCGNRGDDAILQSICELFPDWEIWASNGRYCDVSDFLPVKTVSCRLNEGFSASVLLSMIKDAFIIMGRIAKSDALMFGGGSLIHDLTPYNLPFMYFWHIFAKILHKKVFYFSIGIGPLNTNFGQWISKKVLCSADGLFVRDNRGLELCQQLGIQNVELTSDAAFAVMKKNQCRKETIKQLGLTEKEYFCVTASQWFQSANFWKKDSMDFSKETENFAKCIVAVAEQLKQPLVFVPTVMHDYSLGEELKRLMPEQNFRIAPGDLNCKAMAEIIENSSFLLGVRMHSIICAARQGVPFLTLIYDEKVSQLLKRLDMEQYSLPLETVTPEAVRGCVDEVLNDQEEIITLLRARSAVLGKKVLRSRDIVLSLVSETV